MDVTLPLPSGMEALFPELGPPGSRPVEVTVTVAGGDSRRCVMDMVVAQADLLRALTVAAGACLGVDDFELTVRRFRAQA